MLDEPQLLPETAISPDAPMVGEIQAVAPQVAWGARFMVPPSVVYRLQDPALFEEVRSELAASHARPSLLPHLERPLRSHPPQWVEEDGRARIMAQSEAIYLLGLSESPRAWRAVARLGRTLEWDGNGHGQLTYTASPGLLWDRFRDAMDVNAWLLVADLGVLCAEEVLRIARRVYGKAREVLPIVSPDDPADWYPRPMRLFAGEFQRVLDDFQPQEPIAPLGLPWVFINDSW